MRETKRVLLLPAIFVVAFAGCGGDAQFCQEYQAAFTSGCNNACATTGNPMCVQSCQQAIVADATYAARCAAQAPSAAPGMTGMPGTGYPGMTGFPMTGIPGMTGVPGTAFPGATGLPGTGAPGSEAPATAAP